MTQPQKNTALALAIVAGLVSLPVRWMTLHGAKMEGAFGEMFGEMTVPLTGLNGHVTLLVETPLWLIIGFTVSASVLQLMSHSIQFAVPRWVLWAVALLALACVSFAIGMAVSSGKATLGVGALLGLASAAIPVACLAAPSPQSHTNPAH